VAANITIVAYDYSDTAVNLTALGDDNYAVVQNPYGTYYTTKSGGASVIGTLSLVGATASANGYGGDPRAISWSDGDPVTSGSIDGGIYINALGNGAEFDVSAGLGDRKLRLYLAVYAAKGTVTLTLSDSSASPVTHDFENTGGASRCYLEVDYAGASSSGVTLNVQYVVTTDYAGGYGNVAFQAFHVGSEASVGSPTYASGSYTFDYSINGYVSSSLSFDSSIRNYVSSSYGLSFDTRNYIAGSTSFDYGIRNYVSGSIGLNSSIRNYIGATYSFDASTYKYASATYTFDSSISGSSLANGSYTFDSSIRNYVGGSASIDYAINNYVAGSFDLSSTILNHVSSSYAFDNSIRSFVGSSYTFDFEVNGGTFYATGSYETSYSIRNYAYGEYTFNGDEYLGATGSNIYRSPGTNYNRPKRTSPTFAIDDREYELEQEAKESTPLPMESDRSSEIIAEYKENVKKGKQAKKSRSANSNGNEAELSLLAKSLVQRAIDEVELKKQEALELEMQLAEEAQVVKMLFDFM
jgi:hypothetical protein